MISTIYVSTDSEKPVASDLETSFAPSIPEANGSEVTYIWDYDDNYPWEDDVTICNALNSAGSWAPTVITIYYYRNAYGNFSG